jgi:hypothetical protein
VRQPPATTHRAATICRTNKPAAFNLRWEESGTGVVTAHELVPLLIIASALHVASTTRGQRPRPGDHFTVPLPPRVGAPLVRPASPPASLFPPSFPASDARRPRDEIRATGIPRLGFRRAGHGCGSDGRHGERGVRGAGAAAAAAGHLHAPVPAAAGPLRLAGVRAGGALGQLDSLPPGAGASSGLAGSLRALCARMDSAGFLGLVAARRKEADALRAEVPRRSASARTRPGSSWTRWRASSPSTAAG